MVDPELEELRREFLAEAREKVQEMQSTLRNHSQQAFERLIYLAHQLKGSGGSYGFHRISTNAADLEKAVEQILKAGATEAGDQIAQHVESLRDEVERGARELSPAAP